MKNIFSPLYIVFIILGLGGGYAYYYFVGCSTGSCPMKSNPWIMAGYGALIGYLAADIFSWILKKIKSNKEQ